LIRNSFAPLIELSKSGRTPELVRPYRTFLEDPVGVLRQALVSPETGD
jgi:hypothetical protein